MNLAIGIWVLSLSLIGFCSADFGSRSILREIGSDHGAHRDYAVDVNATSFNSVLSETPATFAIVEFFAHWCPACRNYKPHYEKVARLFNGPDAVHPGHVFMARVDCASKINTKLCDRFSVGHYPMLFWGPPSKFVGGRWDPKKENSDLTLIEVEGMRTADRLLNWINKKLGSSYSLDDEKFKNEHIASNISDPGQIARAIYDVEEATATAFDLVTEHNMVKSNTQGSLSRFLQILVAHHPSKRCRKGVAELLVNFDELFPSDPMAEKRDEDDQKGLLANFQICGKGVPRGYWMFCRGSRNDTRGFSCGLWVLIHTLSVRLDDGESQFAFTAICDFVHNFFICEECRQHFYKMCSSVSNPFKTTRDLSLWLWNAHNKVNLRLSKEEALVDTADPNFPKMIWPPEKLCPSCYNSNDHKNDNEPDWNRDEVFKFLTHYYGKTLVSLYKEKDSLVNEGTTRVLEESSSSSSSSSSALVVPLGAALAIAVASCGFGALACYWRSHQKSRKYFHQLHSLKNI